MGLIDELSLPDGYVARPYGGGDDHAVMASILTDYHEAIGDDVVATAEGFDANYANLVNCDLATDFALIETADGEPVAYARSSWEQNEDDRRDLVVFSVIRGAHLEQPLFSALAAGHEAHLRQFVSGEHDRYRAYAAHPGPGKPPEREAAWLESAGYTAFRFGAALVRPNLDDIPERQLPEGVELRPVTDEQLRTIFLAHWEAFRGSWDFREAEEPDVQQFLADPYLDPSLWKIAWAGDTVVGQVKSYVNHEENTQHGYLRGYTEYISTHADWRNKGIAGTLLAMSLAELRNRGMQQAALGVDTDNPGGALHLYTSLGFELVAYEAVYAKPVS